MQKAALLIASGKIQAADELLEPMIRREDVIGKEARALAGKARIRAILDPTLCKSQTYVVKSGDSWIRISERTSCSIDFMMHLNQFRALPNLLQGQKIKVMPLNYRIVIHRAAKEISLWDGEYFIKSYPIVRIYDVDRGSATMTVKTRHATINGKNVSVYAAGFSAADKQIVIGTTGRTLVIDREPESGKARFPGFYLQREDCNELALLMRNGNKVELVDEEKK